MQVSKTSLLWVFSVGISTFLPCSCRILLFYAHQILRKPCLTYLLQVNYCSVSVSAAVSCFIASGILKDSEVFGLSFHCSFLQQSTL